MHQALLLLGKRASRPSVAMAVGNTNNHRYYVLDQRSNTKFLIDTGAEVSIIPAQYRDKLNGRRGEQLQGPSGEHIDGYGRRQVNLRLGHLECTWNFLVAAVTIPILGADFFKHHKLTIDIAGSKVTKANTHESIRLCHTAEIANVTNTPKTVPAEFSKLLNEHSSIAKPDFHLPTVRHGVFLHIPTTGPPVSAKPRRLHPDKMKIAKAEFRKMEQMGIIRRSNSPWLPHYTWFPKQMGTGAPAATSDD